MIQPIDPADQIQIRYRHAGSNCDDTTGIIAVPSWLSEEPKLAVALYLFGYAGAVEFIAEAIVVDLSYGAVTEC
jgi:hypothetical protein